MDKITVVMVYVIVLLCLAIWAHEGILAALSLWGIGVTLYLGLHLLRQSQLLDWLKSPNNKTLPSASGHWQAIFDTLRNFVQRHQLQAFELSNSMSRFKNAVSVLPDGVVIFNQNQQVEWCNPAAESQLGLNLWRDQDHKLNAGVHHPEAVNYLEAEQYDEPLKIKSRLHPDKDIELRVYTFGAQQKIMVCQDVSQTQKLDAMRRDFIANVSHELRTPLTVVGGFLETLHDIPGAVSQQYLHHIELMEQQTQRMRSLVEDLLTLSRIESDANVPEDNEINMQGLLERILNNAQGLSLGKHKITHDIASNLRLIGAEDEIYSACSNLLNNAIRYTPEKGHIHVTWKAVDDCAAYSVMDTGIGIPKEHVRRITERFYRVDKSRSRDTGGTGLGLSIVKHILVRHQAQLKIDSVEYEGSTFSMVFPKERVVLK